MAGERVKVQHYVPQFMLKEFTEKKGKIWVFDKWSGKVFSSNVKNVACESCFYDFKFEGEGFSIEESLSMMETESSLLLKRIANEQSLSWMTNRDKKKLSDFFAVQYLRTKNFREIIVDVDNKIADSMISRGGDPAKVRSYMIRESEVSLEHIYHILNYKSFSPSFYNKIWVLFKCNNVVPYWVSDNPVVLDNTKSYGLLGNLGLSVKGVEIFLPISKCLILYMCCRSIIEEVEEDSSLLLTTGKGRLLDCMDRAGVINGIVALRLAIKNGTPMSYSAKNVEYCNELQVMFSNRFLFSNRNNFSVALKLLQKYPKFKTGIRISVG